MLRFEDGAAPVVAVDRLFTDFSGGPVVFLDHASTRTLVLRQLMINLTSAAAYRNAADVKCGPLFLEDVVGGRWIFTRQAVWARQFNSERNNYPGTHVTNDGGTLWALGFKTEAGGTQLETLNGGRTEILGGLIGDTSAGKMAPMFTAADSEPVGRRSRRSASTTTRSTKSCASRLAGASRRGGWTSRCGGCG